jgi:hypothetical protein
VAVISVVSGAVAIGIGTAATIQKGNLSLCEAEPNPPEVDS